MKKYEKEILQAQLDNEKEVLKQLEAVYADALAEIENKIAILLGRDDATAQHVVYQVQYQQSLKKQVEAILETLHSNEFETVSEYLTHSYEEGHIGALYSLQQQGVPFLFPLDQEQIVAAVQHETQLSATLYAALGKDTKELSKKIAGEISRGISTGAMYAEIARNVAGYARIPKNNAMRIARTEAHRIQNKAAMNVCENAKSKGADVAKQWNATFDSKTRPSHRKVDGEIRELEEPFSNGLMYPGEPGGAASEVINCRCGMNQRAKWALDRVETRHLGKMRNMSDEELQPLADKLHMSVDELRTYEDQIVPINARSYDEFKREYNKIWHYQGSDLQKEAEARIAGYKNQNKGKTADYLVRNHSGVTNTTNERIVANNAIARTPQKVQNIIHNGTIVDVGKDGASQYDYDNDILYVAKGAKEGDIVHEIGHAVENKLLDTKAVEALRKKLIGTPSVLDFSTEIYYDKSGNPKEAFFLVNDTFVSEYQGRIYVDDIWDAFDEDGNFKDDLLWEFVSEPFREYTENPENLKNKCPEMFRLLSGAVE